MSFKQSAPKGVNPSGKIMQRFFPSLAGKRIDDFLRPHAIFDTDEGVVDFFIADAFSVQLPGQPFVSIDIDLYGIWQPCGES